MNTRRTTAVVVGILFIVAIAFYLAGQAVYDPILGSSDYLNNAYPDRTTVIAGVLLELIGVLAIPLIAVFLFPILRAHNEALALGYVAFRSLEAMLLVVVEINMLSLINISQDYLEEGGVGASSLQDIGNSMQSMTEWPFAISVGLIFPLGALMLYSVLYKGKLVPRFISGWGLIAAALLLAGSVLNLFDLFAGVSELVLELILAGPIFLNEMVLAVWLIAKGFDQTAVTADLSTS